MTTKTRTIIERVIKIATLLIALGLIASLLMSRCTPHTTTTRRAHYNTYASIDIHAYEVLQMKLPAGSIPDASARILVSDSTLITFQWLQSFGTTPYDEQPEPNVYGISDMTTQYTINPDDVHYDAPGATESTALWSGRFAVSEGEYQFQLRTGLWDAHNNRTIWSKYSDAVGVYVDYVTDPADAPRNVTVQLN